jgi:6-phosphogluconolactonase
MINESAKSIKPFTIALSGGSTPAILFAILGDNFSNSVTWSNVHFFWGDERCVPPDDPESNYGMTRKEFLDKIEIPSGNIHRIMGEKYPSVEAERYSLEIRENTAEREGFPMFDLVILGMGEDGHTASIFPGNHKLINSKKTCELAIHPVTSQKRITITGRVINNASNVVFLITGKNKAKVVSEILSGSISSQYPAAHINPEHGILKWYLDKAAAELTNK